MHPRGSSTPRELKISATWSVEKYLSIDSGSGDLVVGIRGKAYPAMYPSIYFKKKSVGSEGNSRETMWLHSRYLWVPGCALMEVGSRKAKAAIGKWKPKTAMREPTRCELVRKPRTSLVGLSPNDGNTKWWAPFSSLQPANAVSCEGQHHPHGVCSLMLQDV